MTSPTNKTRAKLPPLKALLAFDAASRHASFAQGAEELGVTPSAVSHQIGILEDFLGVQLFQRHAGRAVPTSAGLAYATEIAHAFAIIAQATQHVAPQSQAGHLVIASGPSFAAKWLQPRLPSFLADHPGVKVRLSTLAELDDLDAGRFDIAITYRRPGPVFPDAQPLLTEKLRPFCSPALARTLAMASLGDLARATLIHSVNGLTWAEYLRRVGHGSLTPANELWLDRSTMAIDAAVNGMGVILESELLTAQEVQDGRLVAPFDDPALGIETTSYFLIKAPGFRSGTHIGAFEKWLRAALLDKTPVALPAQ